MPKFIIDGIDVYRNAYLESIEVSNNKFILDEKVLSDNPDSDKIRKVVDNLNLYLDEIFIPEFKEILNSSSIPSMVLEQIIKYQLLQNVVTPLLEEKLKRNESKA